MESGRQLLEETDFSRGKKHGKVNYYHANGKIKLEGFHSFNERAGIWQGWHEDGTPSFRSEYADGELKPESSLAEEISLIHSAK